MVRSTKKFHRKTLQNNNWKTVYILFIKYLLRLCHWIYDNISAILDIQVISEKITSSSKIILDIT